MKTRSSTRPDCFRVSYVSAHVARYVDGQFTRHIDAIACAKSLLDGGATRTSVIALFGGVSHETHQFTKGA